MTRTETELFEVLTDRAGRATGGATVLDWLDSRPVKQPRVRRRIVVPLAAAAATVVIALVAVWLQGTTSASRTAAGPFTGGISENTTEPTNAAFFAYAYTLDAVPGFSVDSRNVEPTRQTIVYGQDRLPGAISGLPDMIEAVVYRKGAFDPSTVRTGTALTVNGSPGYYGPASGHVTSAAGHDSTAVVASVAWRYAPDSWAVVTGTRAEFRDRTHELAVARAVHAGLDSRVRVTFQVGYLPTGLRTKLIDTDSIPTSTVEFGRGATGNTVQISAGYVPDQTVRAAFGADKAPLTIGNCPAKLGILGEGNRVDGHYLDIIHGDYWVTVSGDTTVSTEELKTIALGLRFADDGADQSTWFTAKAALPH